MNRKWIAAGLVATLACGVGGTLALARSDSNAMSDRDLFAVDGTKVATKVSDKLHLDDAQKQQVAAIVNDERAKAQPMIEQLQKSRDQIQTLTGDGHYESTKVSPIAESAAATAVSLYVQAQRTRSRVDSVLTPAQRIDAAKMWDDTLAEGRYRIEHSEPVPPMVYRIAARKLSLTPEQLSAIKQIVSTEQPKANAMLKDLLARRDSIVNAPGGFDEATVRAKAEEATPVVAKLIEEGAQTRARIFTVLTPDQRSKAVAFRDEMRQRARKHFDTLFG
ncbi:MAG TPA: Spy/CpxP family protein refolding chaperone [Capsulimonadaceae bacterium]|jgi:Spy/CpxP family protein refolding chaperone